MNKKIFLTGGTGFIGSVLVDKLVERKDEVYVLVRNITDRKITINENANIIWGDLTDPHFLKKTVSEIKPDTIVHLAAISSVAYSHKHAGEVTTTDYIGTINLQKACEGLESLERFIFAGTSEEYGNQAEYPIKETARLDGANQPYAIAKVASDLYLQYCKQATGFPAVTIRPFNSYGRTKNLTFVTESIIFQMLTKKNITLGSSTPTRDLLFIEDHVNGYVKAIDTPITQLLSVDSINLCTGTETTIRNLAFKIADLTDFCGSISWGIKTRPTEIMRLVGDNTRAKEILDWKPEYTLEEGLKITVDNIKKVLKI